MKNKGFIITIVVLVIISLGLGGFIVYDKFFKGQEEEQATITTIDDNSIDLNVLYQIGETLDKFDSAFNDVNSTYFGYIYKDKLLAKDFDKTAALYAIIYKELVGSNTTQYLIGGNIKESYENTFGEELKYTAANVQAGQYYNITYDASTDKYSYSSPTVRNIYSPQYIEKNISTSLTTDGIIVTRKVFYVEYSSNSGGTDITQATIYSSSDKTNKIGTLSLKNGVLSTNEVMAKYSSKISTYKYTFKESDDSTYYFYSIEKER